MAFFPMPAYPTIPVFQNNPPEDNQYVLQFVENNESLCKKIHDETSNILKKYKIDVSVQFLFQFHPVEHINSDFIPKNKIVSDSDIEILCKNYDLYLDNYEVLNVLFNHYINTINDITPYRKNNIKVYFEKIIRNINELEIIIDILENNKRNINNLNKRNILYIFGDYRYNFRPFVWQLLKIKILRDYENYSEEFINKLKKPLMAEEINELLYEYYKNKDFLEELFLKYNFQLKEYKKICKSLGISLKISTKVIGKKVLVKFTKNHKEKELEFQLNQDVINNICSYL